VYINKSPSQQNFSMLSINNVSPLFRSTVSVSVYSFPKYKEYFMHIEYCINTYNVIYCGCAI